MKFPRCADCGAVDAPWSRGHAPTCPAYQPPASGLLCPVCEGAVRIVRVDVDAATVAQQCTSCGLVWTDSVRDEETS